MKKLFFILLFFLSHFVFAQKDTVIDISTGWTFSLASSNNFFKASVPGSIYSDLQNNGLIENPFYGNNEHEIQWVADSVWYYKNTLNISSELLLNQHIELEFEGLDTYSNVWVNDSLVFSTNNMFRNWNKEIKHLLKYGVNEIKIEFLPVSKFAKSEAFKLKYVLSSEERVFVRKAQYQFGWDFAPKYTGCAIWRPVKLIAWNNFKIDNVHIVLEQVSSKQAKLLNVIEITSTENHELNFQIIDNNTNKIYYYNKLHINKGKQKIKANFIIDNPKLWWCNGMGEPSLYQLTFYISDNYKQIKNKKINVGIRKIEVVQQKDTLGKGFYFKLNGIPVFAKGANYVPANYFTSKNNDTVYSKIINDAVISNFNMLRVWGGGIYENDKFYDLCDKNGILIWQDLMFACAMYPGDYNFIENVKQEVVDNVIRLRNHPSIAMWCGNNEIDEGWHNWGWQKQYNYSNADSIKIWNDYDNLFNIVLHKVITDYDSSRFYWTTSPEYGWGKKESLTHGDCHYWGIWWGMEPFQNYNIKVGRFMSEYGFQGFPELKTIKEFCDTTELDINSLTLKSHQKHYAGFETIKTYIEREYSKPNDFNDLIYKSELTQANGIKTAIEAHRRNKPFCMGSLYWQFNDCWPSISWSGIDFYGRWKAMQYFVKEAYQNQILSIEAKNDSVFIYAISDLLKTTNNNILLNLFSFDGKVLFSKELNVDILPQSSNMIFKIKQSELVNNSIINSVVFTASYLNNNKQRKAIYYFNKSKKLKLKKMPINESIRIGTKGFDIVLQNEYLIKGLCLSYNGDESVFSDNYFDMLPKETYIIHCNISSNKEEINENLKYKFITN